MSLQRYAEMIRACLGAGQTNWTVDPRRPADRAVSAYWNGHTDPTTDFTLPPTLTAPDAQRTAIAAWHALARQDHRVADQIAAAQQPSGAYFTASRSDNLETLWYWELVLLHAIATHGLQSNSTPLLDSARRAALYHLHETQPDHATTEPWAINAFLLSPDTYPLADQVLHTTHTQHPTTPTGITALLLADTLRHLPTTR